MITLTSLRKRTLAARGAAAVAVIIAGYFGINLLALLPRSSHLLLD
jgi:hypothetical protein